MNFEEIKLYLPKFLSTESDRDLFESIKEFPKSQFKSFYTQKLKNEDIIFQGDGIQNLMVINLPDTKVDIANCIIFSNTCDIDLNNKRNFPSQIVYSPIIELNKYYNLLISKSYKSEEQIKSHIDSIKKQEITQIFYLPESTNIKESIVFLDRVCNISNETLKRERLSHERLFTLSNYGVYLFILKLSIHFTRIQDKVDRDI